MVDDERDHSTGHAGRVLADSDDLFARVQLLLTAPEQLRARAKEQLEEANSAEVEQRLEAMPLTALKDYIGRGTRLGTLDRAGLRSVADVLDAGPKGLAAIPGVGPGTAEHAVTAARAVLAAVHRDVRFRFDPARRDMTHTALLGTLIAARSADTAAGELRPELTRLTDHLSPLRTAAGAADSRLAMFFSWPSTRRTVYAALDDLEDSLAAPATAAIRSELERRTRSLEPPSDPWASYASEAAAINALLSTIDDGPVDEDAAHGFVPEDLGTSIDDGDLDLTLLRSSTTLRGYQAFGARYALHRRRSILGDEMGLGKTLQALAAIAHLAARGADRFLVVCPASVQINWMNEIDRHTTLAGHSLHGSGREEAGRGWLRDGGVAVTTFGTLAKLPEEVRSSEIAVLVVDEAHMIKNPAAARSRAVQDVIGNSGHTLLLTGSPMENRVEEFRTLVTYLDRRVADRIDPADTLGGARAFRRAVAEVYLRRNQDDVLVELPPRIETESWVHPSASDKTAYRDAVESRNVMTMRRAAWSSPDSAKLGRLREIVDEARQDGQKVLIFSAFLGVLDLIGRELPEVSGRIDGSVGPMARQRAVDEFTAVDGHAVLVSQIEAGGVGINIQAASIVVLTEPQWKPSTEEQAIARAHRMGQIRPVQVHRLLAKETVDERVREIQQGKRLLFDAFARRSDAKEADRAAVDLSAHRPAALDDESLSDEQRVLMAERHRLGLE